MSGEPGRGGHAGVPEGKESLQISLFEVEATTGSDRDGAGDVSGLCQRRVIDTLSIGLRRLGHALAKTVGATEAIGFA